MLPASVLNAINVAVLLQMLLADHNDRRKEEEGLKPRTRRGYARLILKARPTFFRNNDDETAFRLRVAYRTDRTLPYIR